MQAAEILNELGLQGFSFSVTETGGLKVSPASALPDTQRELLCAHKAEIMAFLSRRAANDLTSAEPPAAGASFASPAPAKLAPWERSDEWDVLDKAYQRHHWNCPVCIAAGRGVNYGLRCGAGATLYRAYTEAS